MRANRRAYDTRPSRVGRLTIDAGANADDVARTLASLDCQTLAGGDLVIHISANAPSDTPDAPHAQALEQIPAGPARAAGRALRFGVTVAAGARLAPAALEKIALTFLSFPEAARVWASRSACGRCATGEAAQTTASEYPAPVLAWRYGTPGDDRTTAAGPLASSPMVHVTETLSWTARPGLGNGGACPALARVDRLICLARKPHALCRPGHPVTFAPGPAISVKTGKPRLLMLVPWLAMGGADKFNLDVIRLLSARGWGISVITTLPGDDAWHDVFSSLTDDIFLLPRIARLPDWPRIIQHVIETRRIDAVLVTNSEFGYHLLPALRQTTPSAVFADYCHMEQEEWKNGGYPRLAALYQPYLDRNLVSTRHLKRWLGTRGASLSKIDVHYTNIDAAAWKPSPGVRAEVRRTLGIPEDMTLILFAGRLDPQKQPDVLAATLERLHDAGRPFHAVIAGDGPERARLETRSQGHAVHGSVTMLGAVPNGEVTRLMQAADIFFLPSAMEGLSLALYEAMACGLCVVGAAVGGQRELVDDESGVLVEPGDVETQPERYAKVLGELILQPARRQALGAAARTRVSRRFNLTRLGDGLDRALRPSRRARRGRPSARALAPAIAAATAAVEMTRLESFLQALWHESQERRAKDRT
jgi:glycosyltransferase involved in cell wall biosynthesis